MSSDEEFEQIDEAGNQLEEAGDSGGWPIRVYATLYLTGLIVAAAGVIVWLISSGTLDPTIEVSASLNIGWLLEYAAIFFVGLFVFWTAAMVLIVLPGSIFGGLTSAIARIADSYQLPTQDDEQ